MAKTAARDLFIHPLCGRDDLGAAIPDSPHAVSMALPTWADCVGYEEKDPRVLTALRAGYPRFVRHPLVAELQHRIARERGVDPQSFTLAPSPWAARWMLEQVQRSGAHARVTPWGRCGLQLINYDQDAAPVLAACWQHAGLLPSSRQALAAMMGEDDCPAQGQAAQQEVKYLLGKWYDVPPSHIFCAANGMATIAQVQQAVRHCFPGRATLQLGFPYVDLLKLQRSFAGRAHFIPGHDEAACAQAETLLAREALAAVYIEVPGNPLLRSPDVPRLSAACRRAGVPLIIDDTVASPVNVQLLDYADVVVDSLTKYICGAGDVMGGAAVVAPDSPHADQLHSALRQAQDPQGWWWQDAQAMAERAQDYPQRLAHINRNSQIIVDRLRGHDRVSEVLYPDQCPHYQALRRPGAGNAGLCSLLVEDAPRRAPLVYDALQVSKGPSLGTNFTLACPFTLLAHYHELPWAESCGVSRWLIRFAIGLEDVDLTWSRIAPALAL